MSGWIKIHRQIMDHWLLEDDKRFKWWIIILFEANYKTSKFVLGNRVYNIEIGQSVNSLRTWSLKLGVGTKAVESFFKLLENENMITRKVIGKGKHSTTLVNIENYSKFQLLEETQGTTKKTTQGKRKGSTSEESKEIKNNILKDISNRKDIFKETLIPFLEIYGKDILNEFYSYWTEPNRSNSKMKFELQQTWSVEGRLSTWVKNSDKFNKPSKQINNDQFREFTTKAREVDPSL